MGGDALRVPRAQAGDASDGGGDHHLLPRPPRPLQVPADRGDQRDPEDPHRQGAEVQAPTDGAGDCVGRSVGSPAPQTPGMLAQRSGGRRSELAPRENQRHEPGAGDEHQWMDEPAEGGEGEIVGAHAELSSPTAWLSTVAIHSEYSSTLLTPI